MNYTHTTTWTLSIKRIVAKLFYTKFYAVLTLMRCHNFISIRVLTQGNYLKTS